MHCWNLNRIMNAVFLLMPFPFIRLCLLQECKISPTDCQDMCFTESGVYHVTPAGTFSGFSVYCDMEMDDGGWLVFQRRLDGSVDFFRNWEEYQFGFGNLSGEFWLGNFPLYTLLSQGNYELRVDLEDFEGNTAFAKYSHFTIGGPEELYRLTIGGYSGDAGDSLGEFSGIAFTTKDRDNDIVNGNCAEAYKGAWWYTGCHKANLNGLYLWGNTLIYAEGVTWDLFKGQYYSLKRTEMKIRRK